MAKRGKTIFNSVQLKKPKRSTFNLSHDRKQSGEMGYLYPTMVTEVLPGDKFTIGTDMLIRFAPLLAPVMHRFNAYMHYFFVPNRLVWDNWEDFITNNVDPAPVMPYITADKNNVSGVQKFMDYMGIPTPTGGNQIKISALSAAAYQLIYNEYYRDQNLQTEVPNIKLVDGSNDAFISDLCTLRKRNLEHDYFTSSLPFAQKGAAVDIPLGDVILKEDWNTNGSFPAWADDNVDPYNLPTQQNAPVLPRQTMLYSNGVPVAYDPDGSLTTSPTTINDLRRAFRLQEWLERNALGGTRYIEHILAHFGVKSSDARLQRPEYITGTQMPIVVSEVLNTTGILDVGDPTGVPQGTMAGHGVAAMNANKVGSYYSEEHGYIIGILSIMPRTAYQQGIPKHYLKDDFLDFAFPEFANLGEQALTNAEVYVDSLDPKGTFGYVPRYAEYKFIQSSVAGEFKTTLDYWHAGRIFPGEPALNSDLIECSPEDYSRIFAVEQGVDHLYMQIVHKVLASRLLPFYGTPTI